MTDFDKSVTIGLAIADAQREDGLDAGELHRRVAARHQDAHDLIVVAVPPGTGREARDRIWAGLGTTPRAPDTSEGTLAATAPDADFIRRAYVGP